MSKVVNIGNNQNPVEQYLIEKLNSLKARQKLKRPWDREEAIWQFEEVLFQLRKSNQSNADGELKQLEFDFQEVEDDLQ